MDFKKLAEQATSLSPIMEGKTKLSTEDIITQYPDGITLCTVDMVSYEKSGTPIEYPVFNFAENPDVFLAGGIVLKKIAESWASEFNGDYNAASDALFKAGGVKVRLSSGRSKNGNSITNVEIV